MKIISTPDMPKSNGHYSQCIEHNGLLYLSGQLPINPESKEIPSEIEAQTIQVFKNVEKILTEAGSNLEQIIQVRIYVSDISDWDKINSIYSGIFANSKPVRSIIPVGRLHFDCLLEVEVLCSIE